jgi:hypothetical protein
MNKGYSRLEVVCFVSLHSAPPPHRKSLLLPRRSPPPDRHPHRPATAPLRHDGPQLPHRPGRRRARRPHRRARPPRGSTRGCGTSPAAAHDPHRPPVGARPRRGVSEPAPRVPARGPVPADPPLQLHPPPRWWGPRQHVVSHRARHRGRRQGPDRDKPDVALQGPDGGVVAILRRSVRFIYLAFPYLFRVLCVFYDKKLLPFWCFFVPSNTMFASFFMPKMEFALQILEECNRHCVFLPPLNQFYQDINRIVRISIFKS